MTTTIEIATIITDDPAFIVRDERLDADTVAEYAQEPERLPPVEVWLALDTDNVYLLDGQHRLAAHQQRGLTEIAATWFEGSRPEAEARARVANLLHGLPLTASERRKVRMDVVERLYEYSNNWIAEDFLRCSSNTVAALRVGLEEAGRIPRLERLKRKDGGTTPRTYNTNDDAEDKAADDGLFGTERNIKPPSDLLEPEPEPDNNDGGYNVESDKSETTAAPGLPSGKQMQQTAAGFSPHSTGSGQASGDGGPGQTTLKLAQVGDALAMETTVYVGGEAHSTPVTLLVARGPVAGTPETAPDHHNVLVIDEATARRMGLLFD